MGAARGPHGRRRGAGPPRHVEVTARDRFGNVWRAEKKIEQ